MLDYPVTTPENVRLEHTLAGLGSRLLAWTIDVFVIVLVIIATGMVAGLISLVSDRVGEAVYVTLAFVVSLGYPIILEHRWEGRTVGKRAVGLRVVGRGGLPLTWGQVLLRNLLRPVDMLPGLAAVAGLSMGIHPELRRLGDLVAGTLVIRERRPPAPERILGAMGERRGRRLPLAPTTRRLLGAQHREFLLDLCLRRDALDDAVRMRLFSEVAIWLRDTTQVTHDAGMSDEKLVLSVVAALYENSEQRGTGPTQIG